MAMIYWVGHNEPEKTTWQEMVDVNGGREECWRGRNRGDGKTFYNFSFDSIATRGRYLTTRISGQSILTATAVSFRGDSDEGPL